MKLRIKKTGYKNLVCLPYQTDVTCRVLQLFLTYVVEPVEPTTRPDTPFLIQNSQSKIGLGCTVCLSYSSLTGSKQHQTYRGRCLVGSFDFHMCEHCFYLTQRKDRCVFSLIICLICAREKNGKVTQPNIGTTRATSMAMPLVVISDRGRNLGCSRLL